ncbi:hypothetical protein [Geminisphaera colitermitum]|uniref:hypothetical protein n=1 Tax=Geminisphaera colitermitum TaxID=1148786 RepID=UPI0012FECC2A|nr:hypothetical protein [Geminisphaera colitermitum]
MRRPHSDVAQASRLQSSLLREAPHSIKVTALRAIDKMAGGTPALRTARASRPHLLRQDFF